AFHAITIDFSKSMDTSTLTADAIHLIGPNGEVAPLNVQFRRNNGSVQLTYPTLALGSYQLVIDSAEVKSRSEIALGSAAVTSSFTVTQYSAVWANSSSGFWDVASNWDTGKVPVFGDDVFINAPGATITYRTGTTQIRSLTSNSAFTLSGGTLTIAQS